MSEGKEPSSEWTTPTPRGRWTEKDKTIFRSVDKGFKLVENFEDGIRAFEFEQKQEKETVESLGEPVSNTIPTEGNSSYRLRQPPANSPITWPWNCRVSVSVAATAWNVDRRLSH